MNITENHFFGKDIERVAKEFAALRISVFYEFPYLYEGSLEYELEYIKTYAQSTNAFLFAIYDGSKMVGATTCLPLTEETDDVKAPFKEQGLNIEEYLYFGESIILPDYRGRGYGKRFFELREEQAKKLNKKKTCFCSVERLLNHPLRPLNYRDNTALWRKVGYTEHQEIKCTMTWLDREQENETPKDLIFWIKKL